MTKLLACGMPLDDVITAVTRAPREILGAAEPWLTEDGVVRHATVFRLAETAPTHRAYKDARGVVLDPSTHIVPVATIRDGTLTEAGPK
jgi:dihydroorotase